MLSISLFLFSSLVIKKISVVLTLYSIWPFLSTIQLSLSEVKHKVKYNLTLTKYMQENIHFYAT